MAVGPFEELLQRLGAGLVGRALGERVLDDAEGRVDLAQLVRSSAACGTEMPR